MARTTCRGCESAELIPFLDLGRMPAAGGFLPDLAAAASEPFYPLRVHVCGACGLVQILDAIDPEILFQGYSFSSSTIPALVEHFRAYAWWLHREFAPERVLEFGCNDGVLLAHLRDLGIDAAGIDPSGNITEMARGRGLDVRTGYFDAKSAGAIREEFGPVDVVTGSNVFAHNDDPGEILRAAALVLKPGGHLCLEFMYAGDLLDQLQWDTLYHEHLTFYCLSTLAPLLARHGFRVVHAERIPMHGGSLRIAASIDPREPVRPSVNAVLAAEASAGLAKPGTWMEFGRNIGRKIAIVADTLERLSRTSRIWGYGAAGKATLWVNACGMTFLEAMVDASPLRAGKLMPGTHTPIVFPERLKERPPDYVFVTAWNYAGAIRRGEAWYRGVWAVPLPELRFS